MVHNKYCESSSSSESGYECERWKKESEECSENSHQRNESTYYKKSYKKYLKALNGWWLAKQQLLPTTCNAIIQYSNYYIWRQLVSYGKHKKTALYQEIIFVDPTLAGVPANYPPANPQWVALVGQGSAVFLYNIIKATTRYLNGNAIITYYWDPDCPCKTVSEGTGSNTSPSKPTGFINIGSQKKIRALCGFKCQSFEAVYQVVCQNPPKQS